MASRPLAIVWRAPNYFRHQVWACESLASLHFTVNFTCTIIIIIIWLSLLPSFQTSPLQKGSWLKSMHRLCMLGAARRKNILHNLFCVVSPTLQMLLAMHGNSFPDLIEILHVTHKSILPMWWIVALAYYSMDIIRYAKSLSITTIRACNLFAVIIHCNLSVATRGKRIYTWMILVGSRKIFGC